MVYLLNPHHSGSHKAWANGLTSQLPDGLKEFTLPGRHWKWRMHGAAVHFADLLSSEPSPSAILATDMLDLATFNGLYSNQIPKLLYFHENQLTYPWSDRDQDPQTGRDRHYGWINITSALAADSIAFNSTYHLHAFLDAIPKFLKALPDFRPKQVVERIMAKSRVIPIGFDFPVLAATNAQETKETVLLWNHRWEYDKGPDEFLRLCQQLRERGVDFKLIIIGESARNHPPAFDTLQAEFQSQILHFGFVQEKEQYWSLLSQATLQPVTSKQDFFGMSVVEAQWAGTIPLLPNRLVFSERAASLPILYNSFEELVEMVAHPPNLTAQTLNQIAQNFQWSKVIDQYRAWFRTSII